ncbi:MAG: adenosylcobinamide-GDP ribazoletransferase [Anaerolineales bacterium]|nr:adenosylcobinamide-GDP ribazoletransferase [Anaerolineales bacterium]
MTSLIAAFQFLTIFPTLIKRMFTAQEMGRAVAWFPLVGAVVGLALFAVNYLSQLVFPATVSAALTLFAWIIFTRAFHLDGFMDTCDGLFGGFTPERRLEIMKDSRMGAFGVAGGVLVLLTEYAALHSSLNLFAALILAPTLGRFASPLVMYFFPYAREDGLGMEMKKNVGVRELVISTLITLLICLSVSNPLSFFLLLASAITACLIAFYVMRLLPGLTGDIYGTVTTAVEMLVLVIFTIQ